MISRVAEHCYWMSRYLERAENTARVLEVNQTLLLDFAVPLEQQWRPLLIISGIHDMPERADGETVQDYMTWDPPTSPASPARSRPPGERPHHPRGHQRRDVGADELLLPVDAKRPGAVPLRQRPQRLLQPDQAHQPAHRGISEGTMSHGEAWEFFQLGKYLERACQTARILDVKYHILLPTAEQIGTPGGQRPLGGDPDELLRLRAVPQAAAGGGPGHRRGGLPDLRPDLSPLGAVLPGQVPRRRHAISGRTAGRPGNEVERALDELSAG